MSDLRPRGPGFDSRSGRYQVVTTWMGDCLRSGKLSSYTTNTDVNSAFYPSGVDKISIDPSVVWLNCKAVKALIFLKH